MMKISPSRRVFLTLNNVFLILFAFICLVPFINLLAISLSSASMVDAGLVGFLPVGFTMTAYKYLLQARDFFVAFGYSVLRVVLGTVISLVVITLGAYPLSKASDRFVGRSAYIMFFIVTMFFSGGLIPTYIVITKLGLQDSIFALVLPTAMNGWNMVLLVNFFRQVPKEMEEAASMEGAGHYRILCQFFLPVSLPAIATVVLFTAVQHWNAWFDGSIYMKPAHFPLQTYIYNMINEVNQLASSEHLTPDQQAALNNLPDKTLRSAQIFIAMIPIMFVYPFAQKFFIKGLVLGSVKS